MACCDGEFIKIFDVSGKETVEKALEIFKSESKVTQMRMLGNKIYTGLDNGFVRLYPENGEFEEFSAFELPVIASYAFESANTSYLLCSEGISVGLWEPVR